MELPTVLPEWRTRTVIDLCQSMRESQDFSALPILADALQDAGCPESDPLLARLRAGATYYVEEATLVAVVMSPDAREAAQRITELASDLGGPGNYDDSDGPDLTYEDLMEGARCYISSNESGGYGEYIHMGTNERYKDDFPRKEFWRDYQLLTGKTVADDEVSFFSCSC